jgi:hypothetical protein
MKLDRFESSLSIVGNNIYSFEVKVAAIKDNYINVTECNNKRTGSHLKYCSEYLGKRLEVETLDNDQLSKLL